MGEPRTAGKGRRNPNADVQVELTAMIFDRVLPTILTGGVIMVSMTVAVAHYNHDRWLWWLAALMAALWIGRIAIVLRFPIKRLSTMTVRTAERWEFLYGCYTAVYLSTLGASTWRSMYAPDSIHFTYCVFGIFVLCNAVSARLGTRPRLVLLQCGVMIAPLTVAVLHQPSVMARCTAVLLLGYAFSFWEAVNIRFDTTVDQLRGRHQQRNFAEHDALTGIANRRHFKERLSALCKANEVFAVFFLDLDGFKTINDAHGHSTGDTLLQHVAQRLQGAIRPSELAARLGGDEFAVLHTPNATRETATALASRLIDHISSPYQIDGHELRIGASVGIQMSVHGDNAPDTLLSRADHALYAVKQTGKGNFLFAEADREPVESAPELLTAR